MICCRNWLMGKRVFYSTLFLFSKAFCGILQGYWIKWIIFKMTKKKEIRLLSRLKCMCLTTKWEKKVKQRPDNKKRKFFFSTL